MGFADHYSAVAARYARFRPRYPEELFAFLASLPSGRARSLDCGTGNGQAAAALSPFFTQVVGTDPSPGQLRYAERRLNVRYVAARAEDQVLRDRSVDLLTAAQAAHWFDHEAFYEVARAVLRPGGAIALWCYGLLRVSPAVDRVVERLYANLLAPYWPPARRHVDAEYRTIPFPFPEVQVPTSRMRATWRLEDLVGYLGTWSAVRACRAATGRDPLWDVLAQLRRAWGDPEAPRDLEWPLHVRAGRVE
jgi:SAM-dependent methyltransferase